MADERNGASPMTIPAAIAQKRPSRRLRSLRSDARARCLRRRLHRQPQEQQVAEDRPERSRDPREPRASRRRGRRSADGRRRRHHGADPAHLLRRARWASRASRLPEPGKYAVGFIFMPQDAELRKKMERVVDKVIEDEGQTVLGWRDVPSRQLVAVSKAPEIVATEPCHRQVFIGRGDGVADEEAFERKLYIIRKVMLGQDLLGLRGQAERLLHRLDELPDAGLQGHVPRRPARRLLRRPAATPTSSRRSRSSTSASRPTPSRRWRLAHPYRFVCHNGEINTVRGNVNWMAARQASVPVAAVRRRHPEALADLAIRASPTPPASTTRSSSCCAAATRCRTRR